MSYESQKVKFFQSFVAMTSWTTYISKTKSSWNLIFMSNDVKLVYLQLCQVSSHLNKDKRFYEGEPSALQLYMVQKAQAS